MTPGAFIERGRGPRPPRGRRLANLGIFALAVIGGLAGLGVLWIHLTTDPLNDARAYYDAARRLNEGLPLYPVGADPTTVQFYFYPPLLAIALRPLATLPFHVFAVGWEVVVIGSFVALLWRLGANRRTFLAVGLLGVPIGWAIGVAQAQVPLTLLLAIGQPWSVALAANVKLFPILVAVWWLGRRQYQAVGALAGWMLLLALVQWFLEPAGSSDFLTALSLDQTAGVQNLSPYTISPILWAALAIAGGIGALILAPTRWGWPAAVALATLATPRLLLYMLTSLLAAIREPAVPAGDGPPDRPPTDAAEAFVTSAR